LPETSENSDELDIVEERKRENALFEEERVCNNESV
jgi:hypothetical protein